MNNRHENEARYAAEIARRVLGVDAEVWDTAGRQGAPDVKLMFQDGTIGMLELTQYDAGFELWAALNRDGRKFDEHGQWVWTICVNNFSDYQYLKKNYKHIIDVCEAHGVIEPALVPCAIQQIDPVFQWLALSESNLHASPDLDKIDPKGNPRGTWVMQNGRAGFVSDDWSDLNSALALMFADSAIVKRCKKLVDSEADFRCLMVRCGLEKLPFSVADKLNFGADAPTPSTAPPLPKGIDALMLVPQYKGPVLLWNKGKWTAHYVWDN
jgi:hypothetical protein